MVNYDQVPVLITASKNVQVEKNPTNHLMPKIAEQHKEHTKLEKQKLSRESKTFARNLPINPRDLLVDLHISYIRYRTEHKNYPFETRLHWKWHRILIIPDKGVDLCCQCGFSLFSLVPLGFFLLSRIEIHGSLIKRLGFLIVANRMLCMCDDIG